MAIFGKCEEMWSGKGFEELGKDELLPIKWYTGIETNKIMMRKNIQQLIIEEFFKI